MSMTFLKILFDEALSSSLLFSATSLEDIQGNINHDLTVILSWALTWLVDFNPNKTEAILFHHRPVT